VGAAEHHDVPCLQQTRVGLRVPNKGEVHARFFGDRVDERLRDLSLGIGGNHRGRGLSSLGEQDIAVSRQRRLDIQRGERPEVLRVESLLEALDPVPLEGVALCVV
jgi:hypothetical protein